MADGGQEPPMAAGGRPGTLMPAGDVPWLALALFVGLIALFWRLSAARRG